MTDLWVRQISDDTDQISYRWYDCDSGEQGNSTVSAMAEQWPEATLTLLVAGTDCPGRRLTFKPEEKRHLARLVPFELEADLAQDISGLHVALGLPVQGASEVAVCYIDRRELAAEIDALEAHGLDVRHCYSEPLLLPATTSNWVLRLTDDQVDVCWGVGAAASIDLSMLEVLLDAILHAPAAAGVTPPQALQLQALTQPDLDRLHAKLAASALVQSWQPDLVNRLLTGIWDGICAGTADRISPTIPDLRQGDFARPVRWRKIWRPVRLPLIAAGVAALTFVSVTLLEIQLNNQRFGNLQQDIELAYREVVPAGVLVDAEQQLRAQLGQLRGTGGGSVLALLHRLTPQLAQNSQVSINRLGYNGGSSPTDLGELQISIDAASNTDILQFSEQLNNIGLQARAQNMTQAGDRQQASLIVSGAIP